ncbi:MAG: flavin reductase family protein [Myxococcales bacterium]|nr:flavin reductase family protein [Myxococcales bacterium]
MDLDPRSLSTEQRYKIMNGLVVPRPVAFVSTQDPSGALNIAPFSFFNVASVDPMVLVICPLTRPDGTEKDTLRNARPESEGGLGEFVVNAAVERYLEQMSAAAEDLPHGESEFALTGLTPAPSQVVRPPRLAESPLAFECRTLDVRPLAKGRPMSGTLILGEVVHVYLEDGLTDDALRVKHDAYDVLGRMGGLTYCRTTDLFDFPRGRAALTTPRPFPKK